MEFLYILHPDGISNWYFGGVNQRLTFPQTLPYWLSVRSSQNQFENPHRISDENVNIPLLNGTNCSDKGEMIEMELKGFAARLLSSTDLTRWIRLKISETIVADAFVAKYIVYTICIIATIVDFKGTFINDIHFDAFNTITYETFFAFTCEFIVNLKAICIHVTVPVTFVTVCVSLKVCKNDCIDKYIFCGIVYNKWAIKPAPLPYLTYLRCFIIAATQKQPIGPFCKYWWTRTACRFKEWTLWNNSKVVARSWVRTYRYQPIWISSEKYIIETIVAWVKWHIIKLSIQCTATLLKYQFLNRDT